MKINRELVDELQPDFHKLRNHYDYADAVELLDNYSKTLYSEEQVKDYIFDYVSDKAGFIPTELKRLIDEWFKTKK